MHSPRRPSSVLRTSSQAPLVLLALLIGAGLGLGTAHWATSGRYLGGVHVGPWTSWPRAGSRDADPYARAVTARNADIPLAIGEGLALTASVDDSGAPLESGCIYRFAATTPPARHWTLTVYDSAGGLVASEAGRSGFTSTEILRDATGAATIVAAREAQSGNWLPLPASGRFTVTLRLYDSPSAGAANPLDRSSLPTIERVECLP